MEPIFWECVHGDTDSLCQLLRVTSEIILLQAMSKEAKRTVLLCEDNLLNLNVDEDKCYSQSLNVVILDHVTSFILSVGLDI